MSRVQLALNVSDLAASVDFYSRLFATTPHKLRAGYANFEIGEPPLKLVLIEAAHEDRGRGVRGALNHLGIEVADVEEVDRAATRLRDENLAVVEERNSVCCHALQDKVWIEDPSGAPWEIYVVTDDAPAADLRDPSCCTSTAAAATVCC